MIKEKLEQFSRLLYFINKHKKHRVISTIVNRNEYVMAYLELLAVGVGLDWIRLFHKPEEPFSLIDIDGDIYEEALQDIN